MIQESCPGTLFLSSDSNTQTGTSCDPICSSYSWSGMSRGTDGTKEQGSPETPSNLPLICSSNAGGSPSKKTSLTVSGRGGFIKSSSTSKTIRRFPQKSPTCQRLTHPQ